MAKVYMLYVGVLAGLVLCRSSEAVWNTTAGPTANATECDHHSNGDNCTDTAEQWNGHFSTCPEKLTFYCIHGECRYIKEMDMVSCRCHPGFIGSRCEIIDLGVLIGEKSQIIIICAVVGLVLLILLVVLICVFSHRRGRLCNKKRRHTNEPRNGTEKLHMDVTSALIADSPEQPHTTNSV
ncbi:hypothetical protein NL108_002190 [Boleophthalmus pectinirostris]|uniref:probetacellulin n=1 Tax=Boleophthalmus pectinirostris TaxID=150288 RepID=UPI000A1C75CB|nr:probetacellulin [Boleophthalmus pectinirostris]XP_055009360.1 probetacellulin [Boleophthalmus pectinirostris]XP_055009361.1 probetacellulin [Boleophthalmus pectinirostris]KAJ0057247.1 hypothetical protein NL108_002190 [Boleophthalmus pectinirostris]